ncbi:ATP-grasp domain-containing protein [Litoreibacter roseus]|uniref:ATP-grasp fold PylC-type domain-containing protein n=1 Tax=Litoreibacter roseus TaxID=2601869 RepID=A0A6N6JLQ1_9RHOB|nr:ATP-grasp domain-containing protein [Litoreibacter roseus]GFE67236.1 hypothetical protein KIN_43100 [Litoreibacter roseus]
MRASSEAQNPDFTDLPILLVTAGTSSAQWERLYKWRHPPDTVMIYTQACQAVSNRVHVVPLDQFVESQFHSNFHDEPGLVVDIVGGLFDVELIGLPSTVARSLGMPCFPAGTKNYVTTHDKLLGKHLAQSVGLNVPRTISGDELDWYDGAVIQKPICGGDSVGISRIEQWRKGKRPPVGSFVEEFQEGQDATFHVIRNADIKTYSVIDHIVTKGAPSQWFDAAMKGDANRLYSVSREPAQRFRYEGCISDELATSFNDLMALAGYPFVGRIDVRQLKMEGIIGIKDAKFLELNVAPTISNANTWYDGIAETYGDQEAFAAVRDLPVHPAAKSLALMLKKFYAQSLSMQGNRPVRDENRPN